ncbi:uncharacterized protein N7482_010094 [Penicillium canariense]|uniref:Uncharacterized protein n=1 Tax=Penicillium canariense TaxID=189055 RepID=A0A9W9HK58_9EURO|nr:uncharacterized protein N7482_010094 [Penicillium canariense]KAJ5150842.1 hypothetical protein N7482_010094 [Penicillium canariense]
MVRHWSHGKHRNRWISQWPNGRLALTNDQECSQTGMLGRIQAWRRVSVPAVAVSGASLLMAASNGDDIGGKPLGGLCGGLKQYALAVIHVLSPSFQHYLGRMPGTRYRRWVSLCFESENIPVEESLGRQTVHMRHGSRASSTIAPIPRRIIEGKSQKTWGKNVLNLPVTFSEIAASPPQGARDSRTHIPRTVDGWTSPYRQNSMQGVSELLIACESVWGPSSAGYLSLVRWLRPSASGCAAPGPSLEHRMLSILLLRDA